MKFLFRFLFLFVFPIVLSFGAAHGQNRPAGRQQVPYAKRPAIGEIKGTVLDTFSLEPIPYATVKLVLAKNDSTVGGALTDEKGRFRITEVRPGRYKVEMASIGFDTKEASNIRVNPKAPIADLGRIGLKPSATLDDVKITEEKDFMINKIDRKVYDVSRNLVTAGGGAEDVLNTIPSVEVDIDGNISLRGNQSVTILVDGKPSGLTGSGRQAILDQIPASTIAKIEVITNPSARFDPDGVSGIINIVTKKNRRAGLNGSATVAVGTRDKYNGSVNLNYRNSKVNVFGGYNYRLQNRWGLGITDRTTTLPDTTFRLYQDRNGSRRGETNGLNAGADFYLTPKSTLGFSGSGNLSSNFRSETIQFFNYDGAGLLDNRYDRINTEDESRTNLQGEVNFQQKFEKEGQQLTARASHNQGSELEDGAFGSYDLDLNGVPLPSSPTLQNNLGDETFQISLFQVDYEMPIGEKAKFEAGGKSTFRTIDNDFRSESFDASAEQFISDTLLNNHFIYKEQVHALYATYGRTFGQLSAQGGLRAEQALTNSELETTSEDFENNYFNFFPSGFLAWKPDKKNELRMSYSRRINRPRTRQLNPFTDYSDPLNLRFGNPFLLPEYINSYEFSYARRLKSGNFTSSVYYRRTNGLHTRLITVDDEGIGRVRFVNASFADDIGLELILQMRPTKWWDLTISGNVVQTMIDAENIEADLTSEAIAGSARFVSSVRGKKGTSVQLMVNYRSPRIRPQGRIGAFTFVDAAVKQEVLKGKGDVSIRVSDIFNTLKFQIDAEGDNFETYFLRDRESRIGYLSFSYRFGKQDQRRKGGRRGGGDGGGGMDFDI